MSQKLSLNLLLVAVRDVFESLAVFNSQAYGAEAPASFGEGIKKQFEQLKQRLLALNLSTYVQQHALYAVAALIDEMIMYSDWPGRSHWSQQSMQLCQFTDNQAGEHFFEKLQALLSHAVQYRDLIELYYVCIQLGFSGRYRECPAELKSLTTALYAQIKQLYADQVHTQTPVLSSEFASAVKLQQKWKFNLALIVFLMACQYMGYSMALSTDYHKLKHVWTKQLLSKKYVVL